MALGAGVGFLGYYFTPRRRRIALANLDVAFGNAKSPAEKRAIARNSFSHIGAVVFDLITLRGLDRDNIQRFVEVEPENLEFFRSVLARGKGVIGLVAHYGYPELMAFYQGYVGIRAHFLIRSMDNPYLDEALDRLRRRSGNGIIRRGNAAKKMIEVIREGEAAGILFDQHEKSRSRIFVDFFGLPVAASPSVAVFALATGAPIVAATSYPLPGGRCRVVYGPEIKWEPTGDREQDLKNITQECYRFIEGVIRERPQHYLWAHRRWKSRPCPEAEGWPFYSVFRPERALKS